MADTPRLTGKQRFAERYHDLRNTLVRLRDCPDMTGVEGLSPEEADALADAIRDAACAHGVKECYRPRWRSARERAAQRRRDDA